MSGGVFNYRNDTLQDEIFGWLEPGDKIPNVFEDREISELTYDLFNLIHDFDWYVSGDTGRENYLKAKTKFKDKWLDNRGVNVKRIVDNAIDELKNELYETYNITDGVRDGREDNSD